MIGQTIDKYLTTHLKHKWDKFENKNGDIIIYDKDTYEWVFILYEHGMIYISKPLVREIEDIFSIHERSDIYQRFNFVFKIIIAWCEDKFNYKCKDYTDVTPQPEEAERIKSEILATKNINEQYSEETINRFKTLTNLYKKNWKLVRGSSLVHKEWLSTIVIKDKITDEFMFMIYTPYSNHKWLYYDDRLEKEFGYDNPCYFFEKWFEYALGLEDFKKCYVTPREDMKKMEYRFIENINENELYSLVKILLK